MWSNVKKERLKEQLIASCCSNNLLVSSFADFWRVWLILQSQFASTLVPCPCTEDFIFLKLFYSNEIQNIEVKSSVVGLFEFRVENSFLIMHVSIRLVTYFWVLVLTPILCQHFVIQNFNKLTNTRLYIRYSSPINFLKVFSSILDFLCPNIGFWTKSILVPQPVVHRVSCEIRKEIELKVLNASNFEPSHNSSPSMTF